MTDTQPIPVYGHSGLRGVLLRPLPTTDDEPARVQLENGRVLEVDQSMLKRRDAWQDADEPAAQRLSAHP